LTLSSSKRAYGPTNDALKEAVEELIEFFEEKEQRLGEDATLILMGGMKRFSDLMERSPTHGLEITTPKELRVIFNHGQLYAQAWCDGAFLRGHYFWDGENKSLRRGTPSVSIGNWIEGRCLIEGFVRVDQVANMVTLHRIADGKTITLPEQMLLTVTPAELGKIVDRG